MCKSLFSDLNWLGNSRSIIIYIIFQFHKRSLLITKYIFSFNKVSKSRGFFSATIFLLKRIIILEGSMVNV